MIKNLPVINFTARRGDNFYSNKFTLFYGGLPDDITENEIIEGINKGSIRYYDWELFDICADCYVDDNLIFKLSDYKSIFYRGQFLRFSMTPEQTKDIGDLFTAYPAICRYDLQLTNKETGEAFTLFTGTFEILGDITRENCNL